MVGTNAIHSIYNSLRLLSSSVLNVSFSKRIVNTFAYDKFSGIDTSKNIL